VRIAVQLVVSGGVIAFLLWQLDLRRTFELVGESDVRYVVAALGIFLATTWVMAWRWGVLLAAKGIHEPFGWPVRMYFVGYAVGQVLPTAVGGDAVRIIGHARRRPGAKADAAAAFLMERVLGSAGTLVLVALGLVVAAGRYEGIRLLVVIEVVFVGAMIVFGILLFSTATSWQLQQPIFPLGRRLRLERRLGACTPLCMSTAPHSVRLRLSLASP
jgi:glycosyltransferase 2 family protein